MRSSQKSQTQNASVLKQDSEYPKEAQFKLKEKKNILFPVDDNALKNWIKTPKSHNQNEESPIQL